MRNAWLTFGCLIRTIFGIQDTNGKFMTNCERDWNFNPEEFKPCDGRCYNPSLGQTCDPINGVCQKPEEKCGLGEISYDCFNPETQICSDGNVCNIGEESCVYKCYNPEEKTCSEHGILCDVGQQACGRECYDPETSTKTCENDMTLCEAKEEACGYKCFNPTLGQSCHGMGIICEAGEEYCNQCYKPAETTKKCLKNVKLCEEDEELCHGPIYGFNWCYKPQEGQVCTPKGVQ